MKNPSRSLALYSLLVLTLCSLSAYPSNAVTTGFIAGGEVELEKNVTPKAKGIRILFFTVYDANSQSRMPYGAQKVILDKDAKGKFAKFSLDTTSMMMMASGPLPGQVNIKAKLSKTGMAGPDAPGDLIGWSRGVRPGAKDITVTIDHAVE